MSHMPALFDTPLNRGLDTTPLVEQANQWQGKHDIVRTPRGAARNGSSAPHHERTSQVAIPGPAPRRLLGPAAVEFCASWGDTRPVGWAPGDICTAFSESC